MEFLLGNPFSTPVGQRIERATSSSLPSEDWELNMEICDVINSTEEGPRDAVRAVKKRIVGNKNFKEVMLALTVLETCVKNCGYRLHILVTTRDFVEGVLVRSIIPRNNPPVVLHDRVLGIIRAWADAFRSSPDLTGVVSVYEDLRRKGLEFPLTEVDGNLSTQPPKKNGPVVTLSAAHLALKPPPIFLQAHEPKQNQQGSNAFTPSQMRKLKAELGVVRSNLTVMSDMMSQLDPVTAKKADVELLELYTMCKEMQDRIVKIVPSLSEEKLIEELLAANDEMNSAFSRYQRFERRITNGRDTTQKSHTYVNVTDLNFTTEPVDQSGVASGTTNSCLSQSTPDTVSSQLARLTSARWNIEPWSPQVVEANPIVGTSESDEALPRKKNIQTHSEQREVAVDGFAEAQDGRLQSTEDSPASTRSSSPKLDWMIKRGMIPIDQSNVMDDIEKWLEFDDENDDFDDADGVTSEEFDRFLAERAKAADRLPSLKATREANHSES